MKKSIKILITLALTLCCAVAGVISTAVASTVSEPSKGGVIDRTFTFGEEMEGKSVVFYGDSITAGLGLKVTDDDYMEQLADAFGFYYYNAGSSGASWTRTNSTDTSGNTVYRQLKNTKYLYRDADYICFFLGTNDWGYGRPLQGDVTTQKGGMNSPADGTTIYGAMKQVLNTVITANPDVKIMLLTPLLREDVWSTTFVEYDGSGNIVYDTSGKPKTLSQANGGKKFVASFDGNNFATIPYTVADIRDAIMEVGSAYGCKVVDLTSVATQSNKTQVLQSDMIHVTEYGYGEIVKKMVTPIA